MSKGGLRYLRFVKMVSTITNADALPLSYASLLVSQNCSHYVANKCQEDY